MMTTIPGALRRKGESLNEDGKVRVLSSDRLPDGASAVRGKVLCQFGFIHRPAICLTQDGQHLADYCCDCYEYGDNSALCTHVAALIAAVGSCETIRIDPGAGSGIRLQSARPSSDDEPSYDEKKLRILSREPQSDGSTMVRAKMICDFGFVHYPALKMRGASVEDYECDCPLGDDRMCPHCRALKQKLALETAQSAPVAQVPEAPDFGTIDFSDPELPDFQAMTPGQALPPLTEERQADLPDRLAPVSLSPDVLPPEAEEAVEAEPEEEEQEEELLEPRSMQILFGRDCETNEPLIWSPNDTSRLFHCNTGIIGTMGTGKTQFTKSLITQLVRQSPNNFDGIRPGLLIFDYKGDYNEEKTDFVQATGATVLKPYRLPFNPFTLKGLKRKPQLPVHTANTFVDTLTRVYQLGAIQRNSLLRCISDAYEACGINSQEITWHLPAPSFEAVYNRYMADDSIRKNDSLYSAMYNLHQFQIFEHERHLTRSLYDLVEGVVVFDLSGYDTLIQNLIVSITLEQFYAQMLSSGSSRMQGQYRQMRKFILVDEADNFMSEGFPVLRKILKEGREFGVGTILSTQFLRHFGTGDDDYAKYILTWVVHNVADLKKSDMEFVFKTPKEETEELYRQIKALEKHQSLVKIGNEDPVHIQDLPFWQMVDDTAEGYLLP